MYLLTFLLEDTKNEKKIDRHFKIWYNNNKNACRRKNENEQKQKDYTRNNALHSRTNNNNKNYSSTLCFLCNNTRKRKMKPPQGNKGRYLFSEEPKGTAPSNFRNVTCFPKLGTQAFSSS